LRSDSRVITLNAQEFLIFAVHCQFFPNEIVVITIERKNPYGSPFHDKVCEEKLHLGMKQAAS
jgi:hypothetical protein